MKKILLAIVLFSGIVSAKQVYIDPYDTGKSWNTDYKDIAEMRRITGITREIKLMDEGKRIMNYGEITRMKDGTEWEHIGVAKHGIIFLRKNQPRADNFWTLLHEECHYIHATRDYNENKEMATKWAKGLLPKSTEYGNTSWPEYFAERCASKWMDKIKRMSRRNYAKEGIIEISPRCPVIDGYMHINGCCDMFYKYRENKSPKRTLPKENPENRKSIWFGDMINSSKPKAEEGDTVFLGNSTRNFYKWRSEMCKRPENNIKLRMAR